MPGNQASEPRRWLKKREFLAYYLVYKRFGGRASIGEIIGVLREYFTPRVAKNLFKRLRRVGLLKPLQPSGETYEVRSPEDYLDSLLRDYLERRRARGAHPPRRVQP